MKFTSYSQMMAVIYISVGLIIGVIFPYVVYGLIHVEEVFSIQFRIACLGAGLALGVINYLVFKQFVRTCSRHFLHVLQNVAEKQFNTRVSIKSSDEIGMIGSSINNVIERLDIYVTQAHLDSLTGLPNRFSLEEAFKERYCAEKQHPLGILFLDLNKFKDVNDHFGHEVGDRVLIEVADRIMQVTNEHVSAFRIGGDEFVVLVSGDEDARQIARRLNADLQKPMKLGLKEAIYCGASIGMGRFPEDGATLQEILHKADTEMYKVKAQKSNQGRQSING